MKKHKILVLVLITFLFMPCCVRAESIADYREKIKAIQAEKAENENKSAEVQARIDAANKRISEITNEITQAREDQKTIQKEIEELGKKIEEKEQEIKDLVAFYQISNSDNFYLKYIFGAENFDIL